MATKVLKILADYHRVKCAELKIEMIKIREEIDKLETQNLKQYWEIIELSQGLSESSLVSQMEELEETRADLMKTNRQINEKNVRQATESKPGNHKPAVRLNKKSENASMLKIRKLVSRFHDKLGWDGCPIILVRAKKCIHSKIITVPIVVCPKCKRRGRVDSKVNTYKASRKVSIGNYRRHVMKCIRNNSQLKFFCDQ